MQESGMLNPDARDFFKEVAAAAFANPFSQVRARHDRRLAATLSAERATVQEATAGKLVAPSIDATPEVDAALAAVRAELDRLWPLDLNAYAGEDRRLLEVALLFDTFHIFAPEFDDLVLRQLEAGSQPVKATFGLEVAKRLVE